MNSKDECLRALDAAIDQLSEMKEILDDSAPDSPLAFLEASENARHQINRAVHAALSPLLRNFDQQRPRVD